MRRRSRTYHEMRSTLVIFNFVVDRKENFGVHFLVHLQVKQGNKDDLLFYGLIIGPTTTGLKQVDSMQYLVLSSINAL